MLDLKQTDRMLRKLERFVDIIEPMIFEKVGEPGPVSAFATLERFHCIPEDSLFDPIEKGYKWGEEFGYCWFKTDFVVPDGLGGKDIFIRPHISGYEGTLWVDGVPYGNFSTKIVFTGHGNHYCDLLKKDAKAGEKIAIDLEYYAGHSYKGCHPTENNPLLTYDFSYEGIDICVKNYAVQEFYFDLRTLVQLVKNLPESSFRRASVINELEKVFKEIYQSPDDVDRDEFMAALERAKPYLKKALSVKNGDDAPKAALIGHSHMDTAWLWHVGETVKKCARTYANQLALMDEYPEYKFIQSSSCHSDFLRRKYPDLFARIQQKVKEGRYEPNGGVWVECDCNITSGESMVRQFLWGQRFTRKYFDFTSNCFWLPDTFGYSAAIPQIMKGCCVDYFLTTKIDWNDTNTFPLDTFYWEGIDGTKVFTHFNRTHIWPDAEDLMTYVAGTPSNGHSCIKDKRVTDTRVISYGYGDGGGGPQFEMIEAAKRCADLNGCPKSEHKLVGEAMKEIERDAVEPDTYAGELYLELHRGTLTNQHVIKRNNRKAEFALRDLEIFTVTDAVKNNKTADSADIAPLYEKLLVNQFHDILPGTCIPRAHEESRAMTTALITRARDLVKELAQSDKEDCVTVTNTLSFDRSDVIVIDYSGKIVDGGYRQQVYTDVRGNKKLMVGGVTVPAFSSITLKLVDGKPEENSVFSLDDNSLETPFASVKFADNGTISSFVDKRADREICGDGYNLNTFIMAEDFPSEWDNWDVDADIEMKFEDVSKLVSREVVSNGSVALVIRSKYAISGKSTVTQDMIFFADSAEVRFGRTPVLSTMKRQLLIATRQLDKAVDEARAVAEEIPYEAEHHTVLANLYGLQGNDSLARAEFDRALEIDSTDVQTLMSLADFYNTRHDYAGLLSATRRIFETDALTIDEMVRRFGQLTSDLRFYREYYAQINSLASTLIIRHPDDPRIVRLYADHLIASGELEEALALYKLRTADRPPVKSYFRAVAEIENYLQRPDSVQKYVTQAIALFPDDPDFRIFRGHALSYAKHHERAVKAYREALRYVAGDSLRSAVWGFIGDAYHEAGMTRKCFSAYEKSLRYRSDNVLVLNNYAYFLAEKGGDLEKALVMASRVTALTDNEPTYLDTEAWILFRLGRAAEAKKIMQQAIALDRTNSPVLLLHYGDILEALDERFMAEFYWRKALENGADPQEVDRRIRARSEADGNSAEKRPGREGRSK